MTTEHERLRGLVLVLEDIEGDELARATAHLASCPSCAELRTRLSSAEARMRGVPGLSAAPDPLATLPPADRAAAAASHRALLAGADSGGHGRGRSWPRLLPMALAAGAALVFLVPALVDRGPVRDLQLGSPLVLRGDHAAAPAHGVSFRLSRPGYPVLLHVDAGGEVRLLYPVPAEPMRQVSAGAALMLPTPEQGDAWRSGLTPGCGTYLLAVATERPPAPERLASFAALSTDGDRRAAVRGAASLLRDTVGAVERLDDEGCH
jgi:hypothetical protein